MAKHKKDNNSKKPKKPTSFTTTCPNCGATISASTAMGLGDALEKHQTTVHQK